MDYAQIQAIEQDPDFKALTYQDQVKLRTELITKTATEDPDFAALSNVEKQTFITEYALRPPAFENPAVGEYAARLGQEVASNPSVLAAPEFVSAFAKSNPAFQAWAWWNKTVPAVFGMDTQDAEFVYDALYGRDGDKLRAWMGEKDSTVGTVASVLGSIAQTAGNLVFLKSLPIVQAAEATALGTVEGLIATSGVRGQVLRATLGSLATNTIEDVGLTAIEVLGKISDPTDDPFHIQEVGELYAKNAVLDYAFGVAAGVVLPFARLTGRAFRKTWLPGATQETIPRAALERVIRTQSTGVLPEELAARMPSYYGDQTRALAYGKELQDAFGRSTAAVLDVPFTAAEVHATMLQHQLGVAENGALTLRKLSDIGNNVDRPEVFRSLGEVEERLGRELAERARSNPKAWKVEDFGPLAPVAAAQAGKLDALAGLGERAGFKGAVSRDWVSQLEAGQLLKARPGEAFSARVVSEQGGIIQVARDPAAQAIALAKSVAPVEEAQAALRAARVLKTENPVVRESVEELALHSLRRAGRDAVALPDGSLGLLYPSRLIPVGEAPSAAAVLRKSGASTPLGGDSFVRVKTEKFVRSEDLGRDPVLASRILAGAGDLTPERVGAYLKALGREAEFKIGEEVGAVVGPTGRVSVTMPEAIPAGRKTKAVRAILKGLEAGVPPSKELARFERAAVGAVRRVDLPGPTWEAKTAWVRDNLERAYGKPATVGGDGVVSIGTKTWPSVEAAADELVATRLGPEALRTAMAEDGFRLAGRRGDYRVFNPAGEIVARGASPAEIISNLGWRPSKIPAELGPEVALLENGAVFKYERGLVAGSQSEILKYLDKFENFKTEQAKKILDRTPEGMRLALPTREFEVVIPSAKIRETFDSAREAAWFLRGGWSQYEGVKRVLARRALSLSVENGEYVTWVGGRRLAAPLGDEKALSKMLSETPDPQAAPALLGEEVEALFRDAGIQLRQTGPLLSPAEVPDFIPTGGRRVSALAQATRIYPTPQTRWIQNQLKATGETELLRKFDALVDQNRVYQTELVKWRGILRNAISPEGRPLSDKKLTGLRWFMEAHDEAARDAVVKEWGLTASDLEVAERARDVLGRNPADGLYALIGIDPWKFHTDYMPHIRKATAELRGTGGDLTPSNIFARAFPSGMPREIKFFAEQDRLSELVSWDMEDNLERLLDRYVTQGLKKHYLNPLWRDFDAGLKAKVSAKSIDPAITVAVQDWRSTLMGYKTGGEQLVEDFTRRFAEKLGFGDSTLVKDITRVLFSVQSLAMMGWRGWNVVRNMTQLYTVLGVTHGATVATRALREVARDPDAVISRMKRLGVLQDTPPLLNSLIDERSLMGRLTHKGLAAFKSTDDFTRAAAYVGGEQVFNDALAKLKSGKISTGRDFITEIKAYRASAGEQAKIVELLGAGKTEAARDLFARGVVEDTMFSYEKTGNPLAYRGMVGRLLGQFGVYSVQYIQNVKKGLTLGPKADRLAYAARLAAIPGAFYGAATAAGIAADRDFLPWSPAQFTGGPLFNLALDVFQATGSSYQADEARARLGRVLPVGPDGLRAPGGPLGSSIPGVAQAKMLAEAARYLEDGEAWLAFLALTGTPIRDDLRR